MGDGLFAESNIKPLHIAYFIFVVVYIVVSFFFHLKKNANIYRTTECTFLSSFEILLSFSTS